MKFLKSLVLPSHMAKHRSMSVLFSICILVLTCYLFSLPVGNYYLKNKDVFTTFTEDYMYSLTGVEEDNVKANEVAGVIAAAGLKYDDKGQLVVKEELGNEYKYIGDYTFSREVEVTEGETTKKVTETFVVHLGIYFDVDTDGEGDDKAVPFNESQMYKDFNAIPVKENEKQFLVVFTNSGIIYQMGQIVKDKENATDLEKEVYGKSSTLVIPFSTKILFTELSFNPDNLGNTAKSVTGEVATILSYNYASTNYMVYVLFSILSSCILFPLIIVLLFWLFFKKNGQLKKFKEYFNICAISSIVPVLLCFIVGWFWVYAIEYYIYVFAIYYLFILYKINSNSNLA